MISFHDSGVMSPEQLGVLVPIIAIVLGLGSLMLGMTLDFFKKRSMFQLHHDERMAAIEKGIEVPSLPPEFFQGRDGLRKAETPADHLYRGLRWLLIGAVVAVGMYLQPDPDISNNAWIGLVLVALGAAHLIFYAMEGRKQTQALAETAGPGSTLDQSS